jgi:hypothetical protein
MNQQVTCAPDWWQAVCSIADMVTNGWFLPDQTSEISAALVQKGFVTEAISKAIEWLETASMSGDVFGALAITSHASIKERLVHPLEAAGIHPELLKSIFACRRKGIIHPDTFEQLIENIRGLDSRDWSDSEIESFVSEVIATSDAFANMFTYKTVNMTKKSDLLN